MMRAYSATAVGAQLVHPLVCEVAAHGQVIVKPDAVSNQCRLIRAVGEMLERGDEQPLVPLRRVGRRSPPLARPRAQ